MRILLLPLVALLFAIGFAPELRSQTSPTEFHEGTTGYAIDVGGLPSGGGYVSFVSGAYEFSGNVLDWEDSVGRVRIASLFVLNGGRLVRTTQLRQSHSAFLTYARKQMANEKLTVTESPYVFAGFQGVEMRSSGQVSLVERSFFLNGQLVIVSAFSEERGTLAELTDRVNTFRALTKTERIISLIDLYSPPPLPRTAPATFASTDAIEHRMKGPIAVVREFKQKTQNDEQEFSVEYRYDRSGFLLIEVAFSGGLPEVITSWGWVNGSRANRQASVPVHVEGFRMTSGRPIVSGAQGPIDGEEVDLRYGVMVKTKFDELGRPIERKNISNIGDTISVIKFSYLENRIDRVETDASGGFMNSFRQIFDDNGNVLQEVVLSDKGVPATTPRRFEYKFDERGNWVERKVFEGTGRGRARKGRLIEINTREIQYHSEQNRTVASQASRLPKFSG